MSRTLKSEPPKRSRSTKPTRQREQKSVPPVKPPKIKSPLPPSENLQISQINEIEPFIGYITRIEKFSAAHRLHCSSISNARNFALFGSCNNPNGHGHNYTVEFTVKGKIDPITGMIVNLKDLKVILQDKIISQLDHKHIDLDVPYFKQSGLTSTAENIAVFIWKEGVKYLQQNQTNGPSDGHCKLHKVVLWETEKNKVTYKGE